MYKQICCPITACQPTTMTKAAFKKVCLFYRKQATKVLWVREHQWATICTRKTKCRKLPPELTLTDLANMKTGDSE